MDLAAYAKKMDITPRTAWEHYRRGLIPGAYQAVPRGRRRSQRKTEKIIEELKSDAED